MALLMPYRITAGKTPPLTTFTYADIMAVLLFGNDDCLDIVQCWLEGVSNEPAA